jgi:hypothetical protein
MKTFLVLIFFSADYRVAHDAGAGIKVEYPSKSSANWLSYYMGDCWPDGRNTEYSD